MINSQRVGALSWFRELLRIIEKTEDGNWFLCS